jgi:type II secretory pathway component PulK
MRTTQVPPAEAARRDEGGYTMRLTIERRHPSRPGSVLLAVLIVLPLLFLAAYQFGQLMLQEYGAAQSALKTAQAKAAANSGVSMCAVYLSNPTGISGNLNNNPYSNTGSFQNVQVSNSDGSSAAKFSIVAPYDQNDQNFSANSQSVFRYGVIDESSKININALFKLDPTGATLAKVLTNLSANSTANPNAVTSTITDSIKDWISQNENASPNGAKSTYYSSLTPPYNCKDYYLDTVDELLLVQGVTPLILYGTDWNRNGMQDPGEDQGGGWDPGLAPYLTVYSRELNVDSGNNPRTNVNGTISSTYFSSLQSALSSDLANFVVLYRRYGGTNSAQAPTIVASDFSGNVSSEVQKIVASPPAAVTAISPYDLIDKTLYFAYPNGRTLKQFSVKSPVSATDAQNLPMLLDKTTNSSAQEFPGKVNVLTAPESVLNAFVGVGGLSATDVQTIMQSRPDATQGLPSDPSYQSLAWLVLDAKLDPAKVKGLDSYFTSRTSVYRVQSIGYTDNNGPVARVEAVIDATNGSPRIVMWRDLSELGKGYNIPTNNN